MLLLQVVFACPRTAEGGEVVARCMQGYGGTGGAEHLQGAICLVAEAGSEGVGILLRCAFNVALHADTRPSWVCQGSAEGILIRLADGGTQQEIPPRGAIRQAQVQGVFLAVVPPAGERIEIRRDEGELAGRVYQRIICLCQACPQIGEHELALRGAAEGELGVQGGEMPMLSRG